MDSDELFEDYCKRHRPETDEELIDSFNKQTQSMGAVGARYIYLSAIHHEFERRCIDYSCVRNKEALSFNRMVKLDGKVLTLIDNPDGKGFGGGVVRV